MQPKRDPADRRFHTLKEGGTGRGFTKSDRANHPRRFSLVGRSRDRKTMALPSIDSAPARSHETVRAAARVALLMAIDRQEALLTDTDNPLTLNELSQAVSSLGRIALPSAEGVGGPVTITVVRRPVGTGEALPAVQASAVLCGPEETTPSVSLEDGEGLESLDTPACTPACTPAPTPTTYGITG